MPPDEIKPGDTIEAGDPRECPFCFGKLHITTAPSRFGLIHSVPTCETFDRMEPDDFITAAARRRRTLDEVLTSLGYRRVTIFDMMADLKGSPLCVRCVRRVAILGIARSTGTLLRPCRCCGRPTSGQIEPKEASKWQN